MSIGTHPAANVPVAGSSGMILENLETRWMLSISPVHAAARGLVAIPWQGSTLYAKAGQWIVKLDNLGGTPAQQLGEANGLLGRAGQGIRAVRQLGDDGLLLVETPSQWSHGQLDKALRGLSQFKFVEPDFIVTAAGTPNDSSFVSQWALNNTGQSGGTVDADIDAPEAWELSTGNGSAVAAVIDSGIDYNHPDLRANMWVNPGEVAGNGVDDDGNGYRDDIYGWDFANNDSDPMDDNGHGTHVAGTIAAATNNATGIAGVAWNAKVMALKFLGADGSGSLSAAVSAINYAIKMKTSYGVDIRATNNSWGGGGYNSTLYDAIRRSGQAGILFVAAAGNGGADKVGDNNDLSPSYPASYNLDNIISVAATDRNDRLASFSNYGATSVDLAAPGVSILSTVPGGYAYYNGTSMATPHVTGAVLLAASHAPASNYAAIRSAILTTTDPVAALAGKSATGGRLNLNKMLVKLTPVPVTPPAAPSNLAASPVSSSSIKLTWSDNASNEDGVRVFRSTDGVNFAVVANAGANATSFTDAGLSATSTYYYAVRAYNTAGDSADSNTASATTPAQPAIPSAPSALTLTAVSRTQINLTWIDNSGNEDGFKIERSTNGSKWSQIAVVGTDVTNYSSTGLRKSTRYYYRVRAFNAVGNSTYSNVANTVTLASNLALASAGAFSAQRIELADLFDSTGSELA